MTTPLDDILQRAQNLPEDLKAQLHAVTAPGAPRLCYSSVVFENESGFYPLIGKGELSEPWFWGKTLEKAQTVCFNANRELGLTPEDEGDPGHLVVGVDVGIS